MCHNRNLNNKLNWVKRALQIALKNISQHCVKRVQTRSFFWSVFSRIWTEYGEIRSISPYSVQMRENRDQKNFLFGHFLHSSNFKDFLQKDKSIDIHQKILQYLAIEIYKVKLGISTIIMNEIFGVVLKLKWYSTWQTYSIHTVQFGSEFPNGHIFVDSPSIRRRNFT